MVCALQRSECLYAHHILSKRSWSVLLRYIMIPRVDPGFGSQKDNPYITSSYLWTFSNSPTHPLCQHEYIMEHQQIHPTSYCAIIYIQGRNRWKFLAATSAMVGRICPPPPPPIGWDRVKVFRNVGATRVAPVAPVVTSLYTIEMVPYWNLVLVLH